MRGEGGRPGIAWSAHTYRIRQVAKQGTRAPSGPQLILLSGLMSRLRDSLSFDEDSAPESFGISVEYWGEHAKSTLRNFMGIDFVDRFAAARQCEPTAGALLRL